MSVVQFKSVNRALKRGHLRVATRKVFNGQYDRTSGIPLFDDIPYLQRKSKKNGHVWLLYSN